MLERQLREIGERPMTTCGQEFVPGGEMHVLPIKRIDLDMLRRHNPACGPSGFFCRRDLFERVSFDETLRYAEDWDFMIRVLGIGEIGYVPEPLLYYAVSGTGVSMTTASRSRSWDEIQYRFAAADKHRGLIGESGYRGRVADITLAHVLTRPDRLAFIGHSIRKAGLLATGAALTRKVRSKLGKRTSTISPAALS